MELSPRCLLSLGSIYSRLAGVKRGNVIDCHCLHVCLIVFVFVCDPFCDILRPHERKAKMSRSLANQLEAQLKETMSELSAVRSEFSSQEQQMLQVSNGLESWTNIRFNPPEPVFFLKKSMAVFDVF